MINRRSFLGLAAGTAFSTASPRLWGLRPMPMPPAKGDVEKKLDTFTADYMGSGNSAASVSNVVTVTVAASSNDRFSGFHHW